MLHLKQLRKAKNLKQADIARDINISRQTYSNYERNKRQADYETLLKLAEYFDTTVEYLISDKLTDPRRLPLIFKDEDELYTLLNGLSKDEVKNLKLYVRYLYYIRANGS